MLSRNIIKRLLVPAFVFGLLLSIDTAFAQTKLLRFPDIHDDRVVFTYAGDLWAAPATGGSAIRLTAHPGVEVFAKFSPDGKWIAFTGQYDGVDPDIEVDNDPKAVLEGRDPQLERGIAEILVRLKQPTRLPAKPAGPVKTIK